MDTTLDAYAYEFLNDPSKGEEYARWKNKRISRVRKIKLAEAQREEEARNEADYLKE